VVAVATGLVLTVWPVGRRWRMGGSQDPRTQGTSWLPSAIPRRGPQALTTPTQRFSVWECPFGYATEWNVRRYPATTLA